jgi:CheY-like chemotaxis protein
MVVEDEPDIYDVLLAMFEIWGIEGVAFVDGAEAMSWIENVDQNRVRGELPELAILDIRLPEVSGPEVGHRLRQSPILGNMAIVLITAYRLSPEEEQDVIAQAQADLLMYKPLPAMLELRQKMDGVIAKHREAKAKEKAAPAPVAEPAPPKPAVAPAPVATKETDPEPAQTKPLSKEPSAPPETPEKPQGNNKS